MVMATAVYTRASVTTRFLRKASAELSTRVIIHIR